MKLRIGESKIWEQSYIGFDNNGSQRVVEDFIRLERTLREMFHFSLLDLQIFIMVTSFHKMIRVI